MLDEAVEIAYSLDDRWLIAFLLMLRGLYFVSKDYAAALKVLESSLSHFKSLGDEYWTAHVLGTMAFVHSLQGDLARASKELEQLLPLAREIRDRRSVVIMLGWLGDIERAYGKYDLAKRYFTEFLERAREIGDKMSIAYGMYYMGFVSLHENSLQSARLLFAEMLALARGIEMRVLVEWALFGFACMAAEEKNARRAIRLFAVTDHLFEGSSASRADEITYKRYLALAREQVDEEAFNAAWAEGSALSNEQAIAEAEQEALTPPPASAPALPYDRNALTPREIEVLGLVAAGLSDAQVAAQLVISRRTVSTHLTAIYGKLGVNSRTAAAHYALDHSLI
jgi:ATP/maltotriose-dependent transcriptional regulator MalT